METLRNQIFNSNDEKNEQNEKPIVNKFYNMELHTYKQIIVLDTIYTIIRVPGGWIYSHEKTKVQTFVPYNEEFIFE